MGLRTGQTAWDGALIRREGDKPEEPRSVEATGGACPLWHPGARSEPPVEECGPLESSVRGNFLWTVGIVENVFAAYFPLEQQRLGKGAALCNAHFILPTFSWVLAGGQQFQGVSGMPAAS